MADFVRLDTAREEYVLGPPLCPVSENTPIFETCNPTFELAYWRYGLNTAQRWRERLGQERDPHWDDILQRLAPLPVQDGTYVTYEGIPDMWTRYNFEHPALAGIYGMLPGEGVDRTIFEKTLDRIFDTWRFDRVWGWDLTRPWTCFCMIRKTSVSTSTDSLQEGRSPTSLRTEAY